MNWVSPRIRTAYSFRAAVGEIPDVMARLIELGSTVAPITDRAGTYGFGNWTKASEAAGLRPVYGVELAVSPDRYAKKPVFDYWTFFATENLLEIHKLVYSATGNFRYRPLLTVEEALAFAAHSPAIMGNATPIDFAEVERPPHLYCQLAPGTPRAVIRGAVKHGWPLVAVSDNKFPRSENRATYEIVVGREAESGEFPQHILSADDWAASIAGHNLPLATLEAARLAAADILDQSRAGLRKAALPRPDRPGTLLEMCESGAGGLGVDLTAPEYRTRLAHELETIHEKGFDDYFYIVADLCKWARERMSLGPARGSSCGSLVCYLLGITTVDPIPFGLLFERFLDRNRSDMPDIDIDFSHQKRDDVFGYMSHKYGEKYVARLGTVNMFKARSALDQTAIALNVGKWALDGVKAALIEFPIGDPRAKQTIKATFDGTTEGRQFIARNPAFRIAETFEGSPRHAGEHAAGVVVSLYPIEETVAVDYRQNDVDSRTGTAMCNKDDAEDVFGLLKIDALGLVQLSIFDDALELMGHKPGFLEKLPLDDPAAFAVLNSHAFNGIFQWGASLQQLSKQIKVTEFNDLVSISALARPGPLKSGSAQEWVDRRNGKAVSYPHPAFEPILKETLGVIIYQEQVMRIAREVALMDWGRVTKLRKAIGKSKGRSALAEFEGEFFAGCRTSGVPDDVTDKVWNELIEHGAYSFNKSHSVAYSIISYWCCWMKAHSPLEFAAANLSHARSPADGILVLREMRDAGYSYQPVDPLHSKLKWTIKGYGKQKVLVGPLTAIKGIGEKRAKEIMGWQSGVLPKLGSAVQKLLDGAVTTVDSLEPIQDRIDALHPDKASSGLLTRPRAVMEVTEEMDGDLVVWARLKKMTEKDENNADAVERRGFKYTDGPLKGLSMVIEDDTGEMFAKVNRHNFDRVAKDIMARGREGKALYAIKGSTFKGARIIMVDRVKYIGDMEK